MGAENFVNISASSQRQAKRARVLLAGKLETPYGEIDARLRDISSLGALVECATLPPAGSEVVFSRGSTVVPARVVWTAAGRVGLEFAFPIDENAVLVQLKKAPPVRPSPSAAQSPGRFRRAGLSERLTDDAREAARNWGVTVGIALPDGF
jgi:hypothetical protein